MVQIIRVKLVSLKKLMSLYIPHGSDNTSSTSDWEALPNLPFISHMVQIIPGKRGDIVAAFCFFISHMVQIIQFQKIG